MSDAVLINLITTLGSVITGVTTLIAVVVSRRRTKRDIHSLGEDVQQVRREMHGGEIPAHLLALDARRGRDVHINRPPSREPRGDQRR